MASHTFKTHQKKQIIRILCAILLTFLVQWYFATLPSFWMFFATIFVMLTKRGSALYQGLLHFFILVLLVLLSTWLSGFQHLLYPHAEDIVEGALIGIACNLLIFPDRVDVEFRQAVIPLMDSMNLYFSSIAHLMLDRNFTFAEKTKITVEQNLLALPSFIYDRGFDITMRKGHQYFFMKIAQLSEILFTLHHVARYEYDEYLLEEIRAPLLRCVEKINALSMGLKTVLELKQLTGQMEDFYSDITEIERIFKHLIPLKLMRWILKKNSYFLHFLYPL